MARAVYFVMSYISLLVQYLDENKQLIMAILDNQNSGKVEECARYILLIFLSCCISQKVILALNFML
jgi:SSXT protein (N-terminal region)